jgi:type IX secretion system PorP/SprF family membrane protein
MKHRILLFIFIFYYTYSYSQDLHFSQFYNSPLNLNPAEISLFNGDKRFTLSYRDQWGFVPVPWKTFSLSYDMKKYLEDDYHFLGFGGNINYDRQGDSKLTLTSINLGASYTRQISTQNLVTGGLMLGYSSRGFDQSKLTWDKQWTGAVFNSALGSGETFNFNRVNLLESAIGANFRHQRSPRTKFDVGVAAYHFLLPTTTFYSTPKEKLPINLKLSATANFYVLPSLDVQLNALHQNQEEYQETLFGALGKMYLNKKRGKETEIHVGLGIRTSGSLYPTIALQYNDWYASFNYDLDNTDFNNIVSINRGGPELHLRYIIKSVRPLNERKNCPIY